MAPIITSLASITKQFGIGSSGRFDLNTPIGISIEGGFFAGLISHTADGNATHALIVAPSASGYNGQVTLQLKTSYTATAGTTNVFNGAINSANMNDASHPAAQYCEALTIGGYSDWYLPALWELDIAYENLKPTTGDNNSQYGPNLYSVPLRTAYRTVGAPAQTSLAAFQSGGAEAFVAAYHWSSTESGVGGIRISFSSGDQDGYPKNQVNYVRAFRKFAL